MVSLTSYYVGIDGALLYQLLEVFELVDELWETHLIVLGKNCDLLDLSTVFSFYAYRLGSGLGTRRNVAVAELTGVYCRLGCHLWRLLDTS